MHAQNHPADESSQRHVGKDAVEVLPELFGFRLPIAIVELVPEAVIAIRRLALVVASEKLVLIGKPAFEGQHETKTLHAVSTSIHVVAEEYHFVIEGTVVQLRLFRQRRVVGLQHREEAQ